LVFIITTNEAGDSAEENSSLYGTERQVRYVGRFNGCDLLEFDLLSIKIVEQPGAFAKQHRH
jgi:hypothetical protein